MKRSAVVVGAVVSILLTGVLLARAAWHDDAAPPTSPSPALTAAEAADPVRGPAGWHYRHTQPTHWRSCLLQQ